jgi:hypothetical protein
MLKLARFGLAAALLATGAAAHPVLTYSVTSHVQPAPGQSPAQPASDETFPLIVTLGHQFLIIEAKGKRTLYDFERSRLITVDLATKTFEDDSLYSNIGFRVLEFRNRLMIGGALHAANLPSQTSDVALVEHLFSLTDPNSHTAIDAAKKHGDTLFGWQQHDLMSVSDRTADIPAGYQAEYWRFLRYYAGGHPRIFEALSGVKGVAQKTVYVLVNLKTETRTLTLQNISNSPDVGYSLDGFAPATPDREPFKVLALVGADAAQQESARVSADIKDRDAAFAQGRYLDALLANNEAALSSGHPDGAWLQSAGATLKQDPSVAKLVAALANHDPAQEAAAADTFAALRSVATEHSQLLELFEGNARLALRPPSAGEQLLLDALRKDPYIVGVWHDLADYYYRSFRMTEAWACMDAARRIAPDHPMVKPFNDLEHALRARNPEFF